MRPSNGPRVALVTGARRGIGRYLSQHLLKQGYKVVGCGRNPCEWKAEGFTYHKADVTDEGQVTSLVRFISKEFGRLDVLLNNAGVASMNHMLLMPLKTAQTIVDVNLLGPFVVSREAAKIMRQRKRGQIVNFGSSAVSLRLAGEAMYIASKCGLVALTHTMARELADFGITVNLVGPSPTDTDMIRGVPKQKIEQFLEGLPIKRLTTFEDIANVIDFFLAEASEAITGQVIYLNGMPNL